MAKTPIHHVEGMRKRDQIVLALSFQTWTSTKDVGRAIGIETPLAFHHLQTMVLNGVAERREIRDHRGSKAIQWRLVSLDEAARAAALTVEPANDG